MTGAGASAAATVTTAAALLRTLAREAGNLGLSAQAAALVTRAERLAHENAAAYALGVAVLQGDAPRAAGTPGEIMGHTIAVPERIAATAAAVGELAVEVGGVCAADRRADAAGAAMLAESAARVAVMLIGVNLTTAPDDDRLAAAQTSADAAAAAANAARGLLDAGG